MATLEDLLKQGATKIRHPNWNKHAHIVLPIIELPDGERGLGPWATLRDLSGDPDDPIYEQKYIITALEGDNWELWEEVPWPWETQS